MKITKVLMVVMINKKKQLTGRRGRNPLLESTAQPPTKRKRALASIIDEGESPYYRDNFINSARRTNELDPVIDHAHAGLTNCDVICYSNAIFQGLASCIHVSQFLQSPPKEDHRRLTLYHAFASVMSSMVSGQECVVDPTPFVNLFRESRNINYAQGMFFDSQWMNQLTMYVPLTDYSSR
jgi:ubiquitin C-terminal hydrolase